MPDQSRDFPDYEVSRRVRTELIRRLCDRGWGVEGSIEAEEVSLLTDTFLSFPIFVPVLRPSAGSAPVSGLEVVIEIVELYRRHISKRLEQDRHSAVNQYLTELHESCLQVMEEAQRELQRSIL